MFLCIDDDVYVYRYIHNKHYSRFGTSLKPKLHSTIGGLYSDDQCRPYDRRNTQAKVVISKLMSGYMSREAIKEGHRHYYNVQQNERRGR